MKNIYAIFLVFVSLVYPLKKVQAGLEPQSYSKDIPKEIFVQHKPYFSGPEFIKRDGLNLPSDQSQEWQSQLKQIGEKLISAQVRRIIFVHGTFSGDDPFGIKAIFKNWTTWENPVSAYDMEFIKNDWSYVHFREYLSEYVQFLETALGQKIPVEQFVWSSQNHHAARVKAAVDFTSQLTSISESLKEGDKVIIVGLSHGAQLLALFSNFLNHSEGLENFLEIDNLDHSTLKKNIEKIQHLKFEMITMGGPPRYGWGESNSYHLLHLINHHRTDYLGAPLNTLPSVLRNRIIEGDYIQQWGIAGSDLFASSEKERDLNLIYDSIIGVGTNFNLWKTYAQEQMRVPRFGETYLVNYQINSNPGTSYQTVFGHIVYTFYEHLLFNMQIITDWIDQKGR